MFDPAPLAARAQRNSRSLLLAVVLSVACQSIGGFDDFRGTGGGSGGALVSDAGQAGEGGEQAGDGSIASGGSAESSGGTSSFGGSSGAQSGGTTAVAGTSASGGTISSAGGVPSVTGGASSDGGARAGDSAGEGIAEAGSAGAPSSSCSDPVIQHFDVEWTETANDCDPVAYDSNPPAGGGLYPTWATFKSYDFPLPKGFAVHNLSHGGVVFWYNCPHGCADEVAEVKALIADLPEDPTCVGQPSRQRIILTPAPDLPVRWALSAAGYTLSSECVNRAAFEHFYLNHFGQGPEATCSDGIAFDMTPCP